MRFGHAEQLLSEAVIGVFTLMERWVGQDVVELTVNMFQAITGDSAFMTLPGVFSHGQLDKATAILLEHIPAPANGRVLDLACGSGVIGLTYKLRNPKLDITLSDTDAFALRSAQLNSVRLQAPAEIIASDGLKDIDGKFDYILTNPPFHQGKDTDYRFAQELFRMAKAHLVEDDQGCTQTSLNPCS